MSSLKIFTVVSLLLFPLIIITSSNENQGYESSSINDLIKNADKQGQDNVVLDSLAFIIRNSSGENNYPAISGMKKDFKKAYLTSLIHKKKEDYTGMFKTLYLYKDSLPEYYPFYDELVFSANASGNLSKLENNPGGKNSSSYILYLDGCVHSAKGNYSNALESFSEAFSYDSLSSRILFQLADIHRNLGNYKKSSSYLERILKIHKEKPGTEVVVKIALGALFFLSGEYSKSDEYYNDALETARKTSDSYNETRAYINTGINKDVGGDIHKAREYFYKALEVSKKINEVELEALALSELGVSFSYTYDLSNARRKYIQSFKIYKRTGNNLRLALLCENLGKIYSQFHDYSTAVKYFEEGIMYAKENKRALYLNKSGLAGVMSNLGNYARSLKLYRECEKLSTEIEDNYLTGDSYQNLGQLNYNLGRYTNAMDFFNKADIYYRKSENLWNAADIMHKKGLAYLYMDSIPGAEACFENAISSAKELKDDYLYSVSLIDYAGLKLEQEKYKEALSLLQKAQLVSGKNNFDNLIAESYLTEGRIYEKEDRYFDARKKFQSAAEISISSQNYSLLTECNYRQALLYEKYNLPELAESYYRSALAINENKGRPLFEDQDVQISFYKTISEIYTSFADFYLEQKKYKEAFEIIDRSHSRNSIHNLGNIKLKSLIKNDSIAEALYEYDWQIQSGIYDTNAADSISFLYNTLKDEITKSEPEAEYYIKGGRYFTLNEVQENLSPGENIILIRPSESCTYVFRISSKDFDVKREDISGDEIRRITSAISPVYEKPGRVSFFNQDLFAFNASASAELYSRLLKNTFSGIPENGNIIFISSSEMSLLPFEFLVTGYTSNESAFYYDDKTFLINKYNISYAPSVSVYINQKKNILGNDDKYLVVGNPFISSTSDIVSDRRSLFNMDTLKILPLKYSANEVSEISSILQTNQVLTEKNATETNFRSSAANSRIIHISTHSFLMDRQPVIFFSNTNDLKNDGFLETAEIVQMKLNADLVVLSSCNSGIGRIDEAEGVIGMTKAFFEAGTKSIVVSLWEVNDKYTSAFMTLFYDHLSKGLSKTEALRKAKLDFIDQYSSNPYYWSAFILAGNTDGINLKTGTGLASLIVPSIILLAALSLFIFYLRRKNHTVVNNL